MSTEVIEKGSLRHQGILTRIKNNMSEMRNRRSNWESIYQDIVKYVHPYRGDFITTNVPGRKRVNDIYDTTGPFAAQEFASALGSFLTDTTERWGAMETFNVDLNTSPAVRQYFEDVENVMYDMIFGSPVTNFEDAINEMYLDLATFGTAIMFIEDRPGQPITYKTYHLGQCFIRENDAGRIDTVYREFNRSYRQILERWPDDIPASFKKKHKDTPEKQFTIIHAVEPSDGLEPIPSAGFAFTSVYTILQEAIILNEGGFTDFPYVVPRWRKVANEWYGRSQSMMAMPHIKMVNAMAKTVIKAGQRATSPAVQAPDDGFVLPLNMGENAINYYRSGSPDRIEPIQQGARPDIGLELINGERQQIQKIFFIDILRLPDDGVEKREAEIFRRSEDRMRSISPMMGRLTSEGITPIWIRTYRIAKRRGLFPELPPELQNTNFRIKYKTQISRAQKASQLNNMSRMLENMALVFNLKPDGVDRLDVDGMIETIHELTEAPEKFLVSREEAEESRAARAEQEQGLIDSEQAQNQSQAFKNVAPLVNGGPQ